jgi:hypothetical protein
MVYLPNWKNCIIVSLIVALVLCCLCKSCTDNSYKKQIKDLEYTLQNAKKDTTTEIKPKVEGDWQEPILVLEGGKIPGNDKPRVDSFIVYEKIPVDTTAIVSDLVVIYNLLVDEYERLLSEYTVTRLYTDTARFKDAIGIVDAEVSGNRLVRVKQTLDSLRLTTITHTIPVPEKPKVKAYVGVRGGYQPGSQAYVGAALGLKLKNDMMIKGSYLITASGQGLIGGELDIPINKKRQ